MHEYGITKTMLAKVAAKAFRNGSLNPMAWRRKALSRRANPRFADDLLSADPVHVLLAGEGGVALVLCRADPARRVHRTPGLPPGGRRADPPVRVVRGVRPALAVEYGARPDGRGLRGRLRGGRRRPRRHRRRPAPGHRGGRRDHAPGRDAGSARTASRRNSCAKGATEIGGRLPINTDGGCLANGEPIGASGLRQVYEASLQLRGDAGERQVPGEPTTAFTHVYGAPGVSAVTIMSR